MEMRMGGGGEMRQVQSQKMSPGQNPDRVDEKALLKFEGVEPEAIEKSPEKKHLMGGNRHEQ